MEGHGLSVVVHEGYSGRATDIVSAEIIADDWVVGVDWEDTQNQY